MCRKSRCRSPGWNEARKRKNPALYIIQSYNIQRWVYIQLSLQVLDSYGRDGRIRTSDPVHPMHVRYQAALRPDEVKIIADAFGFLPCFPRDSLPGSKTRSGRFIRPASARASPCVCLRPGRGSVRPGCAHAVPPGPGTWRSWR